MSVNRKRYAAVTLPQTSSIFFSSSALYGLILRGGDLVGTYSVNKNFALCMASPAGFVIGSGRPSFGFGLPRQAPVLTF